VIPNFGGLGLSDMVLRADHSWTRWGGGADEFGEHHWENISGLVCGDSSAMFELGTNGRGGAFLVVFLIRTGEGCKAAREGEKVTLRAL